MTTLDYPVAIDDKAIPNRSFLPDEAQDICSNLSVHWGDLGGSMNMCYFIFVAIIFYKCRLV